MVVVFIFTEKEQETNLMISMSFSDGTWRRISDARRALDPISRIRIIHSSCVN